MKKLYMPLLLIFIIAAALTEQGCDILNNLFLNLPIKQTLEYSGSDTPIFIEEDFCLSEYDEFDDNVEDIEGINFVGVLYRTDSCSAGLHGSNTVIRLLKGDRSEIWSVTIPSWQAEDYIDNALEIDLTPAQVDAFNEYLAEFETNDCYYAELTIADADDNNGAPYYLRGKVELVVELEIKP